MGYQMLTYHDGSGKDVWQPIFTPEQLSYIHLEDDTLGSSDQMPFTMAGLPCATLVGNSTYYDPNAPQASYPYDQPDDTIQLMNIFADGNSQQSQALTMALALPGMITSWMLSQSAILGQTSADGKPVATISSIGLSQPGQAMTFDGGASYYPAQKNSTLNYHWNFGDGAGATGQKVSHTYAKAGTYTLSLTISTTTGSMRTITKRLNIGQSTNYSNPYAQYLSSGEPPHNPVVTLPAATAGLSDQVGTTAQATQLGSITHSSDAVITPSSSFPLLWVLIGVIVLVVLIAVAGTLRWVWRK